MQTEFYRICLRSSAEQTDKRMSLLLLFTTDQMVAWSIRSGSKILFSWSSFQTADAKVLFDVARDRILERFKVKKHKIFTKKSSSSEMQI